MKNPFLKVLLSQIFFVGSLSASSQISVSGPTCVIPGTSYQYNITGNWDSSSTMSVTIEGGAIDSSLDMSNLTKNNRPVPSIFIIWNNTRYGSLIVNSSNGNSTISVSFTTPLVSGLITDSALLFQSVSSNNLPSSIICSADRGGSCSPTYSYQWQRSIDGLHWMDIEGANDNILQFTSPLVQTSYYRRKVIETISGTVGYSNTALIEVIPSQIQADTTSTDNIDIRRYQDVWSSCNYSFLNGNYRVFKSSCPKIYFLKNINRRLI